MAQTDKSTSSPSVAVGFVTYGDLTAPYLKQFLLSLDQQTYQDYKLYIFDNSEIKDNANARFMREHYSSYEIEQSGLNLGFARSFNWLINRAKNDRARFFLMLNPDMVLEPGVIASLVNALEFEQDLAAASPCILRWDYAHDQKTDEIDTCGIGRKSGLVFKDVKQGEALANITKVDGVIAPSGAAGLYRLRSLLELAHNGEVFDELMFMYKEDCDLAYRLEKKGLRTVFVPEARIYHDRTVTSGGEGNLAVARNRNNKSKQARRWAFRNQQIITMKHWRSLSFKEKIKYGWHQIKMHGYIIFKEPWLLSEYRGLIEDRQKIKVRSKQAWI